MFSSTFLPQAQNFPTQPPPPPLHSLHPYQVQVYNIDEETPTSEPTSPPSYPSSDYPFHYETGGKEKSEIPFYSYQAITAHNRRMIIPYKKQPPSRNPGSRNNNRVITSSCQTSTGLSSMRDEPLVMYRFFEFYCSTCEQSWLSPLYRAKDGLFCRICHQFYQPRGIRHSLTPYLGKETCYGKYLCHNCNRGFSSYKSLSNCPDQCFQCGTLVYPYYQIAHSVLYQKIRKNDTTSIFTSEDTCSRQKQEQNTNSQNNSKSASNRRSTVRKIASGIITSNSSAAAAAAKQSGNKKRLHCLNNAQLSKLTSSQLGRRQIHLKACYSEPTIGNCTF